MPAGPVGGRRVVRSRLGYCGAARAEARGSGSGRTARAEARGSAGACAGIVLLLAGCAGPPKEPSPAEMWNARNEQHVAQFGDFELPRKIGTVENVGLQMPVISPDGEQMLYLRTDRDYLSPMTLLGSPEAEDTPPEGTLSIWIRPVTGTAPGERLSSQRWAHSPVWSDSRRAVAYVVNEPPASYVVHHDLESGTETQLGVPDAVNCLPRFDGDDGTLLFCSGEKAAGPFRVYRQVASDGQAAALTPEGADCVFPIASDGSGHVLCARAEGDYLNWARCSVEGMTDLARQCGEAQRPNLLQTWAGIPSPVSPDGSSFLFYGVQPDRTGVCHLTGSQLVRHIRDSIAACWLTNEAVAVATDRWVFAVHTLTGKSLQLLSGAWIPARYVPAEHRLLLLGTQSARRFSIVEIVFKPR